MKDFPISLSETDPDTISDRFLLPRVRFQWKQFRNLHVLLKPKLVKIGSLTNTANEKTY